MTSLRALCVMACVLTFSQNLRAFSAGPPANRNGISGTFCTACHRTNALNSGDGSVRVVGLPSAWLPGEAYTLQVIVSHPTARRWGFQLSAVGPDGQQAGDLVPAGDGRTRVVTGTVNGQSVQFIEHTSLGATIDGPNVFQFTYRAPADASISAIRFNLAGNAANGDGTSSGDFIYAIEFTLPLLASSPAHAFTLATRGTSSFATTGGTGPLSVACGRMQTSSGTAGTGLAFIDYRQNNILTTEVGLSAVSPIRTGRIYSEVSAAVNTGVALVNPNSQSAVIAVTFNDDSGGFVASSTLTLGPTSQVSAFVNEPPFSTLSPFQRPVTEARTFTFDSTIPIGAAAVRVHTNERGEIMMTSLPVSNVALSSTSNASLPHVADGGGWATEVVLVNASDATETGTLQFMTSSGQAMSVSLDGQSGNQFNYSIPRRSSRRFRTAGTASTTATGWIEVAPTGSTQTPSAAAILSEHSNNVMVSETTIEAAPAANSVRVFAESFGNYSGKEVRSLQTGLAVANAGTSSLTLNIEATNLDGTVAGVGTLSVPARGQAGLLLRDISGLQLPVPFTGILWVSAPAGSMFSAAGLRARYNERSTPDLLVTGFAAFDEAQATTGDLVFPQIVASGGFTTQFALMGVRGTQSAGSLQFNSQTGQAMPLSVR